ncbi:MAG: hypothetical protein EP305_11560 [Bacteroidetes bacterium]|nr:MAG: hypothetical protein EP305_11560 [Bacteroidota bacterium]
MSFFKQKEFNGHVGSVFQIDYLDGFVYSVAADAFSARWDLEKGTQDQFTIRLSEAAYAVKTDPTNSHLFVGLKGGSIHVIDLLHKKELRHFVQHRSAIFCLQINSQKGHWYSTDADGNLGVWTLKEHELLLFLPLNSGKIRRIAVSSDGERIALACQDGTIRVLDTTYFNEIRSLNAHEGGSTSVSFIGDDRLITGGKDALLKSWDLENDTLLKSIPAHNYVIYDILKLNDELWATCSRDKTIKIWDSGFEKVIQRIELKSGGHRHSVNALTFISSNEFASCSDDGKIIVWMLEQ